MYRPDIRSGVATYQLPAQRLQQFGGPPVLHAAELRPISQRAGAIDPQQIAAEVAAHPVAPADTTVNLTVLKEQMDKDNLWLDPAWTL